MASAKKNNNNNKKKKPLKVLWWPSKTVMPWNYNQRQFHGFLNSDSEDTKCEISEN